MRKTKRIGALKLIPLGDNKKPKQEPSITREEWLTLAIEKFGREHFKKQGYDLPKVKVSVGLPYGRGGKKAIGQHWHPNASDDKVGSIFISPTIDDGSQVLGTLIHELVHAAVGNEAKHGPKFRKCALSVGLCGKMQSTEETPELKEQFKFLVKTIGKYPHAKLNLAMNPTKKQTTRMLKVHCEGCGFLCRAALTKLLEIGPPSCACNGVPMTVDFPEDTGDGSDDL